MSFGGYLDAIEAKTGKSAANLRALGTERGWSVDDGLAPVA